MLPDKAGMAKTMKDVAPSWDTTSESTVVETALAATFNTIVAAAVTLLVGIFVFAEIADVMPEPENNSLANASDTVQGTTGNAFTLGAVAIIVLVATLILGLIGSGFAGGGGGGMGGGGRRGPPRR
jgi:hypothetical protein